MGAGYGHQYIERETARIRDEKIFGHRMVHFIYSDVRENAGSLFRALTSARITGFLAYFHYDCLFGSKITGTRGLLDEPRPRALRVHRFSPVSQDREKNLRAADQILGDPPHASRRRGQSSLPPTSRVLVGSFSEASGLFLKNKFFDYEEIFGEDKEGWLSAFEGGDYAVFRLTPDKYHYNHAPVSGRVVDIYQIEGGYHSCNPEAVIAVATPFSKNKRVVTIVDTDVEGGTGVGLVAMIEVVAPPDR